MQQTTGVMTEAARETLAGRMHQVLMAQLINIQNWDAAAKLFAEMQQAAAIMARAQEWK